MNPSGIDDAVFIRVVARFYPQSRLVRTWALAGGVSAQMTALEIAGPDGRTQRLVLRRHGARDMARNPSIATAEFRLLQILQSCGMAALVPLHLDESREILDSGYLILEHVEGEPLSGTAVSPEGLSQLASLLVAIHRLDGCDSRLSFLPRQDDLYAELLDRNRLRHEGAAITERIRDALRQRWPISPQNPPSLLHGDVWPGNVIWRSGRIVAVVDWEDAALGDPLSDVANARLELFCSSGAEAAAAFTDRYLSMTSIDMSRLPAWDLCAAVRGIASIANWGLDATTEMGVREGQERFAVQALATLSASN